MNIRKNEGITLITLVITIVLLLIISGISITGTLRGNEETEEATQPRLNWAISGEAYLLIAAMTAARTLGSLE